jgi:predicted DNA binding protein
MFDVRVGSPVGLVTNFVDSLSNPSVVGGVRYLDVTLDLPSWLSHPMQEFMAGTDAIEREALHAWQPDRENGLEYALFFVRGERDAYRRAISSVDAIVDFELSRVDDAGFYSYVVQETRPEDAAWRSAFAARNLVVPYPVVYDETGRTRLTVVGADDDLRGVVDDLPDEVGVTVHGVGRLDFRLGSPAAELTDRQLEAVRVARDMGYYEVPRDHSLEDVADAMDVARSTLSTHLRKAERALVERAVGERPDGE